MVTLQRNKQGVAATHRGSIYTQFTANPCPIQRVIVKAEPNAIFNQSVLRTMRLWKYEGRPAQNLTITIIFKQDVPVIIQNA